MIYNDDKELSRVLCSVKYVYLAALIMETVWTSKSTAKVGRPKTSLFLYVQSFGEFFLTIFGGIFCFKKSHIVKILSIGYYTRKYIWNH